MERYYNLIRCWIVLIPTLLLVASCQEGHEAGDLFGMWRLTESKYISFSGMKPFTNIRVKIDAVDGDRLLLSKDGQRWSFEKW